MKNLLRATVSVIMIFAVITVPKTLYGYLTKDAITEEIYRRRESYFYGVIELWQVDCFEGGTGSRANWLKSITGGFEKKHNGVYVNVEKVTPNIAKQLILSGKKPDIISFGNGLDLKTEDFIKLNGDRTGLLESVQEVSFDEAVPWCMGAYVVLGDGDREFWGLDGKKTTGKKGEKTVYSVALAMQNGYFAESALKSFAENSFEKEYALITGTGAEMFEAYNYSLKANRMLGTQRDIYRRFSAEKREKARQGEVTYIDTYCDLFQYIGILNCSNEKKNNVMQSFIEYLLGEKVQSQIGKIGMFPVRGDVTPEYACGDMTELWEKIKNTDFKSETHIFG